LVVIGNLFLTTFFVLVADDRFFDCQSSFRL
jgi:hypothetical protein